ncbi:MAG: MurR/RpiR family transcriptional regulator [Streptosporangiales bacterium]
MAPGGILIRLGEIGGELTDAEARVADYLLANSQEARALTITVLAQRSSTSEATVVRLCKKLRLRGYQELRLALAQDAGDPRLAAIHENVALDDGPGALLGKVFAGASRALGDTLAIADEKQFERAVDSLRAAETVNFLGIGASGAVAQDAYFRFIKLGKCCYALTESSSQLARVALVGAGDVVVAISHSGRSRDLVFAVETARRHGCFTIGITQFGQQPLVGACDVTLFTSSSETAFHSEAMASRIAQHALLDALFVGVALGSYEEALANLATARELTAHLRIPASSRATSKT